MDGANGSTYTVAVTEKRPEDNYRATFFQEVAEYCMGNNGNILILSAPKDGLRLVADAKSVIGLMMLAPENPPLEILVQETEDDEAKRTADVLKRSFESGEFVRG